MLYDIISRISRDFGYNLQSTADHDYLVDIVFQASKDFYEKYDLKWCHFEDRFTFDRETNLLTLPWYVKRVGSIRNVDQFYSIGTTGMARRYRDYDWPMQINMWRNKGEVPTAINLVDASPLKFTIPSAVEDDINIAVVGKTNNSYREIEEIILLAGQTTVSSTSLWEPNGIQSIVKDAVTKYDVTISAKIDGIDTDVGEIANLMLEARYSQYQAFDLFFHDAQNPFIEVLFKHEFVPMLRDKDSFLCGPMYETAIEQFARAKLCMLDDKKKADIAGLLQLGDELCKNADKDIKEDEIESCIASPNPISEAIECGNYSRSGTGSLYTRRGFTF